MYWCGDSEKTQSTFRDILSYKSSSSKEKKAASAEIIEEALEMFGGANIGRSEDCSELVQNF